MEISTIDDRDVHRSTLQLLSCVQTGKPRSDDDDPLASQSPTDSINALNARAR